MKRINELKTLIKQAEQYSAAYYNEGNSSIGDYEYDKLIAKIQKLETETGIIFSNSPTQSVGAKVKGKLNKIKHKHKMLSLGKLHDLKEVVSFIGEHDSVAMVKMDGLTISAEYRNGELTRLETRGDGEVGNDVLFHASSFVNLPKQISYKGNYVIDGEAIISYSDFELINSELSTKDKYRNPRNLAAGTLNLLDQSESKNRHLQFVAWDVIEGGSYETLEKNLCEADSYGFTVVPMIVISEIEDLHAQQLSTVFDSLKSNAKELGYPNDGIVVKYNDIAYGASLGAVDHHFNNAIAYKFSDELYETKIRNVDWSMGKTGRLCPVAVFDPVEIDGTIVERATLHNLSIYNELGILPGDTVLVYKANQIIPQVDRNLSAEERFAKGIESYLPYPDHCPICGSKTKIIQSKDVQVLACSNDSCTGSTLGKLKSFVSKQGMDITGFSESTLEKLISKGWIDTPLDIYNLKDHKNDMQRMDGFGVKSVTKLLDAIEESKKVSLDKFVCALSIEGVGKVQSKAIAKQFDYRWENFVQALEDGYNFSSLNGFGAILNQRIYNWYGSDYIIGKVNELASMMEFEIPESKTVEADLKGLVFVITGSLNYFANRDTLKAVLELRGAKVTGSVSAKTSYLVNNDSQSASSKNKKAKELGVPIITEDELKAKFGI